MVFGFMLRVVLVQIKSRKSWYLLFGAPETTLPSRILRHPSLPGDFQNLRVVSFEAGDVFAVRRLSFNDYGLTSRENIFVRVPEQRDEGFIVPGFSKPVDVLMHTQGKRKDELVTRYLRLLAELELDPTHHPELHRTVSQAIAVNVFPERAIRNYARGAA